MATAVGRKSGHFYFQRNFDSLKYFPAARKADGSESPRRPRQRKLELGRHLRSNDTLQPRSRDHVLIGCLVT